MTGSQLVGLGSPRAIAQLTCRRAAAWPIWLSAEFPAVPRDSPLDLARLWHVLLAPYALSETGVSIIWRGRHAGVTLLLPCCVPAEG